MNRSSISVCRLTVRNGYSCVPLALSKDVDIHYNRAVRKIITERSGVKIVTTDATMDSIETKTYEGK